MEADEAALRRLLKKQSGAIARSQVPDRLRGGVRWQLDSGRWQRVHDGFFVNHTGAVTPAQLQWIGVLGGGAGAALCGPTAAELGGLKGFETRVVHVCIPWTRQGPKMAGVRYHAARAYAAEIAPNRQPPRIQLAAALLAMASAARSDARAHDILTSAGQQSLIRTSELRRALAAKSNLKRRGLIRETLLDIDDGAGSLNEVALLKLVRRYGLPRPVLQIVAATARRRSRIDGTWPEYGVCFEVDGVGHFEIGKWIDDADRQNEIALARPAGTTLLRWPGVVVRRQPEIVADQARRALRRGGWHPA